MKKEVSAMTNNAFNAAIEKKSPFAAYNGERLNMVSANPAACTVRLTDLDELILLTINQMLITTAHLLDRHLHNLGLEGVQIDDIRTALARLSESGFLTKYEFVTPVSKAYSRVYTLGQCGQEFVKSRGQRLRMTGYIASLDALHAKRLLASLQYVISRKYSRTAESVTVAGVVVEQKKEAGAETDRIFRPQVTVQCSDHTVFVDAVRRTHRAAEELADKLTRMDETLRCSRYLNISVKADVYVVIVCESTQHMAEVMEELDEYRLKLCYKLWFTNDAEVFNNPGACLHEFACRKGVLDIVRNAWTKIK